MEYYMKNYIRALVIISATIFITSTQVYAEKVNYEYAISTDSIIIDDSDEAQLYKEKAKLIRDEIVNYASQIKVLKEYNLSVSQKFIEINKKYRENKDSFPSEKMAQIKELKKSIIYNKNKEKTVSAENSLYTLEKNRQYDKALLRLEEILATKKELLKITQENNAIWHQIDAIIG